MLRAWVLLALVIPWSLQAKDMTYGDVPVAAVTSIYDADTFRVTITGWPAIIGERVPVRVLGVDAPEIRGKCQAEKVAARKAKQFTVAALRGGKSIVLHDIQRGKYFRILARVSIDGKDLARQLIDAGLARAYDGGTRQGWCATGSSAG